MSAFPSKAKTVVLPSAVSVRRGTVLLWVSCSRRSLLRLMQKSPFIETFVASNSRAFSARFLLDVTRNPVKKQPHECCHALRWKRLRAVIGPNERTHEMHQQRPDEQIDGGIQIDSRDDSMRYSAL